MADDGRLTAELAAIKERIASASPGPWEADTDHDMDSEFSFDVVVGPDGQMAMETIADLQFAAHAREDVPRLVKALEAAVKLIDSAVPAMSGFPADCTNVCYDDACNCSGIGRPLAWNLDPTSLREAITSALTGTETT